MGLFDDLRFPLQALTVADGSVCRRAHFRAVRFSNSRRAAQLAKLLTAFVEFIKLATLRFFDAIHAGRLDCARRGSCFVSKVRPRLWHDRLETKIFSTTHAWTRVAIGFTELMASAVPMNSVSEIPCAHRNEFLAPPWNGGLSYYE